MSAFAERNVKSPRMHEVNILRTGRYYPP